jgi:hypothetical protein
VGDLVHVFLQLKTPRRIERQVDESLEGPHIEQERLLDCPMITVPPWIPLLVPFRLPHIAIHVVIPAASAIWWTFQKQGSKELQRKELQRNRMNEVTSTQVENLRLRIG